jgi:hypothetical protein
MELLLNPQSYANLAHGNFDGAQAAHQLLADAGLQQKKQETLASVDLQALSGQLVPSLDGLGSALRAEIADKDKAKALNECFEAAPIIDSMAGTRDLGSLLNEMGKRGDLFSEATRGALAKTQAAMGHSILEFNPNPEAKEQGLSGLSFTDPRLSWTDAAGKPMEFETGMPQNWVDMGKELSKKISEPEPKKPEEAKPSTEGKPA